MGLLTSVNNINYRLEEEKRAKEAERKAKEKERQKAKEEKEEKEQIKNEITTYLADQFTTFLLENGSNNIYYFYNINKKAELLNNIYNMHTLERINIMPKGKKYVSTYIDYKEFITIYFNNNYYKILKKAEEEAKRNEEYKIYAQLTTPKKEEYQQETPAQPIKKEKHIDFNKINKVINIIFTIILIVLFFPIAILIAACKKQK